MKELVILTGYSGAGKSTAAGLLEDLGFFCIDNLPPDVAHQVASLVVKSVEKLAIVLDARSHVFGNVASAVREIKERFAFAKIVFLTAKRDVIIQRFAHTRRAHPLSKIASSVNEAIDMEIDMMKDVIDHADIVIDTSTLNPHQLRERLTKLLAEKPGAEEKSFVLHVVSFGFKYGIPLDADFVFDVRFFPNPFYVADLRSKNGLDKEVKTFMESVEGVHEYVSRIELILKFAMSRYELEGRNELTVAIGCTGGRHRSVYFADLLAERFQGYGYGVTVEHRDVRLG